MIGEMVFLYFSTITAYKIHFHYLEIYAKIEQKIEVRNIYNMEDKL